MDIQRREFFGISAVMLGIPKIEFRKSALGLYQPINGQREFHDNPSKFRILVGRHRSGLTLAGSVELAAVLRRGGTKALFVRRDWLSHQGSYLWLFESGAFQYNGRDTPPLIPPSMIGHIAWHNKSRKLPAIISFQNGSELWFQSSEEWPFNPGHGGWDGVFIDGTIESPDNIYEHLVRCAYRPGRLWWCLTPQVNSMSKTKDWIVDAVHKDDAKLFVLSDGWHRNELPPITKGAS